MKKATLSSIVLVAVLHVGFSAEEQDVAPVKLASASGALHNLMQLTPRLYSGGEPHDATSFAELRALGIKTVVSVDGARPDVEAARAHGIRYIHVPIGYDGIPEESAAALSRLVREVTGSIYFHCHHGRHRGPAAAALALRAETQCSVREAFKVLELAGTNPDYKGLWHDVESFDASAVARLNPELHEIYPVGDFAARMAAVDRTWDRLKLCREAGWSVPPKHPDVDPPHEALMLLEGFREMARESSASRERRFVSWLEVTGEEAAALEKALKSHDRQAAEKAFASIERSCKSCHKTYRN